MLSDMSVVLVVVVSGCDALVVDVVLVVDAVVVVGEVLSSWA